MPVDTSYNNTHIMENTTAMIDEAFDALRDTFNSLFGNDN